LCPKRNCRREMEEWKVSLSAYFCSPPSLVFHTSELRDGIPHHGFRQGPHSTDISAHSHDLSAKAEGLWEVRRTPHPNTYSPPLCLLAHRHMWLPAPGHSGVLGWTGWGEGCPEQTLSLPSHLLCRSFGCRVNSSQHSSLVS
jgi:hypothetical protein